MNHNPCSHYWIDPSEPPIQRASYAPVVGPLRRQMKAGALYVCQNCKVELRPLPPKESAE